MVQLTACLTNYTAFKAQFKAYVTQCAAYMFQFTTYLMQYVAYIHSNLQPDPTCSLHAPIYRLHEPISLHDSIYSWDMTQYVAYILQFTAYMT